MAISKDLFLSILAMDSYNRGYGAGISDGGNSDPDGLGETKTVSKVGKAAVSYTIADADLSDEAKAAGFYAIAYDTEYGTVISYRGTDDPDPFAEASDFWKGWTIGGGFIGASTQADEALAFYSAVTGKDYWEGAAANTIVTGHSLGGGLAGFVSFLTGTEGVGFDHMSFGIAAALQSIATPDLPDGTDHALDTSNFSAFHVDYEVLEYLRSGAVPSVLGALPAGFRVQPHCPTPRVMAQYQRLPSPKAMISS